ncbi:hypothetical protein GCM10027267_27080 [Paramicrobacterium agarici]
MTLALRHLVKSGEEFRLARALQLHLGRNDLAALTALCEEEPLTPRDLARRMEMTSGTITPLLDRVERAGYVTRNSNPDDRRSLLIALTEAGRQAVEWVNEEFDTAINDVIATMSKSGTEELASTLEHLSVALEERIAEPAVAVPPAVDPSSGPHAV